MSAYVVSELRVVDAELFARYRALAKESIEAHGGEMVVRGASPRAIEGEWPADWTMSVTRFPDRATLESWYGSTQYQAALDIRRRGAIERRMLFVDGAD